MKIGFIHINKTLETKIMLNKFEGYASVFDIADNHDDIIKRGAFIDSIAKHEKALKMRRHEIKLLWQHKPHEVIGTIDNLQEDDKGLFVKASIIFSSPRGKEAINLIRKGTVAGLSIGFRPVEYSFDKNYRRIITKLNLYEISVVTFPANEYSNICEIKMLREKDLNLLNINLDRALQAIL